MVSMSMGRAWSTTGFSWLGSGPSRIEPKDMRAASLKIFRCAYLKLNKEEDD